MRVPLTLTLLVLLLNTSTGSYTRRRNIIPLSELSLFDFIQQGFHFLYNTLDLDPEAYLNAHEIIEYNDFPVEIHHVTTDDGYILEVYRISGRNRFDTSEPSALPRSPVILWPEVAFPPSMYVSNIRNESLAFILADAGFDVWLGSWRGTEFSRKHHTINPDSDEFWKFSLDEFGRYDVADTVRYVYNLTGKKVVTMGEGYGGLSVMLGLISRQEINPMINLNIGMSPVATMNKSFNNNVQPLFNLDVPAVLDLTKRLGVVRAGLKDPIFAKFFGGLLAKSVPSEIGTKLMIAGMGKFGSGCFNHSRVNVFIAQAPFEFSVPLFIHIAEGFMTNVVRQYDWGEEENLRRHGTAKPQEYDFKKISSNYLLLRTFNDLVKNKVDSDELRSRLPDSHDFYFVPEKNWHHMSYMFSTGGKAAVYDYLIDYIRNLESGKPYRNIEL